LRAEIRELKKELESYKSYNAERAATELVLVLMGIVLGAGAGFWVGLQQ
jgi:uncharacterized protein HemX